MTQSPSLKEALQELRDANMSYSLVSDVKNARRLEQAMRDADRALATFQPSGERREAIARILYPTAFMGIDEAPPNAHKQRQQSIALGKVDELFASGFVQNEACITPVMVEAASDKISEMLRSGMTGKLAIEKIARAALEAAIRSARDGGAET